MSGIPLGHLLYIGAAAIAMAVIILIGYLLRRFGKL